MKIDFWITDFLPEGLNLSMSKQNVIWCSHPKYDEFSTDGSKKFWKTGPKPSHPKGKRVLGEDLVNFINGHDQRIINGK